MLRPEHFWFAASEDVSWFADPADGRYAGSEPVRWSLIRPRLTEATEALRAGDWSTPVGGISALPSIDVSELTSVERWVLGMFFFDPVEVDPWDTSLSDGRHRTWGAWHGAPTLLLPLRSRLLGDAAAAKCPVYAPVERQQEYLDDCREEAKDGLRTLPAPVRRRSPRYVAGLEHLAA